MEAHNAGRSTKGPQRDALGRWKKGSTGNRNGRPRKWSRIEDGNLEAFIKSVIEVQTADGPKMMTRDGILLNRLFQSAMQGNVHAQIYLDKKFGKWHQIRESLGTMLSEYYAKKRDDPTLEFTAVQKNDIALAEYILYEPKDPYRVTNAPRAPRKRSRGKRRDK